MCLQTFFVACYLQYLLRKMPKIRHNLRLKMKIPKPRKGGDAYRIEIIFNGQRYSCTRGITREFDCTFRQASHYGKPGKLCRSNSIRYWRP